jgi:hypothetical protein
MKIEKEIIIDQERFQRIDCISLEIEGMHKLFQETSERFSHPVMLITQGKRVRVRVEIETI